MSEAHVECDKNCKKIASCVRLVIVTRVCILLLNIDGSDKESVTEITENCHFKPGNNLGRPKMLFGGNFQSLVCEFLELSHFFILVGEGRNELDGK